MSTLSKIIDNDELNSLYSSCDLADEINDITLFEKDTKKIENIVEFDENIQIKKADRYIYTIAVISGLLTGLLDAFFTDEISLVNAQNWGDENVNSLVVRLAQKDGYRGNDLKDAIRLLENNYKIPADKVTGDFGGGLQHHLRDFTHHGSLLGLIFSIATQFTGKAYGTDTEGKFVSFEVPVDMLGTNFEDKLYQGVVIWAMHLVSDMAGASGTAGRGTGIPGPVLSFFKGLSSIPIFNEINLQYKDDKIGLSVFISKLFNGTFWGVSTDPNRLKFDLRMEIGIAHELTRQIIPILINECIVRGCYSIATFVELASEIDKIVDLKELDYKIIVPFNNKRISRMLVISTGIFSAVNLTSAYVKSRCVEEDKRVEKFFLSLNYMGIVRFCVACSTDVKCTIEDVKHYSLTRKEMREKIENVIIQNEEFTLGSDAQELLYNLKCLKIRADIDNTKLKWNVRRKEDWYCSWNDEECNDVISGESLEENAIYSRLIYYKNNDEMTFYKLLIELIRFVPYFDLFDGDYDKLKSNYDYEREALYKKEIIELFELKLLERKFDPFYKKKMAKKTAKRIAIIAWILLAGGCVLSLIRSNDTDADDYCS